MAARDLTINLRPDRTTGAFIQSYKNGSALQLSAFYREEKVALNIYFVAPAPTGGLSAPLTLQSLGSYDCRVGIGVTDGTILCAEDLVWDTDHFEGVLNINTTQMNAALDAANGADITKTFEVELKNGTEEFTFQQTVTVRNEVLTTDGGVPEDVTETLFADRLQQRFLDSDTVDVARTGDDFNWHVRRKADGGIGADTDGIFVDKSGMYVLPALAASFTVASNAATPVDDENVVTVGGFTGIVYQIRARVVGRVEKKNHSGGTQLAGDNTHVYRDGTPSADNFNLWYLDISDPPQRIHLNHATSPNTFDIDYEVDFKAKAGATVALGFDTIDGLSYEANSVEVTQVMAEDAGPIGQQTIWIPAAAMTKRTTDGPADASSETTTNKVMVTGLEFDPDTPQFAQFSVAMPKSWDEGTVMAEFLWMASGGTGSARWGIQGRALSDGDALDAAFGTAQEVTDALGAVDTLRTTAATAAVTIAGTPATKDLVVFQVYRDADDVADTLDAAATLIGVRLLFTTDAENDN